MPERAYNVLFLGRRNAARSLMAEAMLNRDGRGRFQAFSAGREPKPLADLFAVQALQETEYSVVDLQPKSWERFACAGAPVMDVVITLCDHFVGVAAPAWPGAPVTVHWPIDDPAVILGLAYVQAAAYRTAQEQLHNRISLLLALPGADLEAFITKSGAPRAARTSALYSLR